LRDLIKYNREKDLITDKLDANEEFQKKIDIFATGASLFLWFVLNKLFMLTKETADQEHSIMNIVKSNTILEEKIVELLSQKTDECVTTTTSLTSTVNFVDDEEGRARSRSKSRVSKVD
jgi:hypothetical protein